MKVGATGLVSLLAIALAVLFAGVAFAGPIDSDGDGVLDNVDNCPTTFNPSQTNSDVDSHGDACDNCRDQANELQVDSNSDGCGNQCDADIDNDGVVQITDFGAWTPTFGQATPPAPADNDFNGITPPGPGNDSPPDGVVQITDFGLIGSSFGGPPGPGVPPDTDCDGTP